MERGYYDQRKSTSRIIMRVRGLRTILLLLLAVAQLPTIVKAQFCKPLKNSTWAGFVQAVVDSYGFAVLCPFEISGDRCHSEQEYPYGYLVTEQSDLIIVCDPFLYGYNSDSECIINCPGRHFTVDQGSSLTLDSMILSGATDSSIRVEANGKLAVIDSMLQE
jgi:hypothetical protein